MTAIVIGLSHRTTSMSILERATLDGAQREDLLKRLNRSEQLHEVLLLDTCNRIEVYAYAATFHGAVTDIGDALAESTGIPLSTLREHLYVHFSDRAVAHLFSVAAGLESMAVGESQILGQLRDALRVGRAGGYVGGHLDGLVQQSLRVGKRAHSETDIDTVSRSLVERGIGKAEPHVGPLADLNVLVVGAGAMSSLAAHTISRAGAASLTVINRTHDAAERLALAVGATARPWTELPDSIAQADLIVSCTGALGYVIDGAVMSPGGGPQSFVDLALPRDIAPEIANWPMAQLISLESLHEGEGQDQDQVSAVRALVASEVDDFRTAERAASVAPTVALLRAQAADVMTLELDRLRQRAPGLTEEDAAQVRMTVHRVVEKLLHTPTVRIKELAGEGHDYTAALRALFDLDPAHAAAVTRPPAEGGEAP
ncbi:glutamyl-tRNA reductase [Demetria terragena]|uniref:glutamyl-tRNA reductase n=1 Tax=Demetria terragena TaxID=63959 RepID=UPI0003786954|nr:glutamyl-tRNA reductase [Demetria terragena]